MSLKRAYVLEALVLCLVLVGLVDAQAQGNAGNRSTRPVTTTVEADNSSLRAQVAAIQVQLDQALAHIAQLQSEDTAIKNTIAGLKAGVTQAQLDAAVAALEAAVEAEGVLRSTADAALEQQIANEAAERAAADLTFAPLSSVTPLTALIPLASYVKVDTSTINGLAGPHVIFSGANVHVRSGDASGDSFAANGRGNLVIGYNEDGGYSPTERGGSHTLVIGPYHRYNFAVGLISGYASRLGNIGASVTGGAGNEAGGMLSSVSGGANNRAMGQYSSVSGGDSNDASGNTAAVSAGQMNEASGALSSVSGGFNNTASATASTVGGGNGITNAAPSTFVP